MKSLKLLMFIIAVSISMVCCVISKSAFAFTAKDHHTLTIFAFEILEEMYPSIYQRYLKLSGEDSLIRTMSYENISWEDSDEAAYSTRDDLLIGTLEEIFGREHSNFVAFNHFINIGGCGKSQFDDCDGYSYKFIKKYGRQHQRDARLFGEVLDTGIMWYYNDEYVHLPGQQWYDGCSL